MAFPNVPKSVLIFLVVNHNPQVFPDLWETGLFLFPPPPPQVGQELYYELYSARIELTRKTYFILTEGIVNYLPWIQNCIYYSESKG